MRVRKSKIDDLNEIQNIYQYARDFMAKSGNPNQWQNNRPSNELIKKDIDENGYVILNDDNEIVGCFALIPGNDPTYSFIEGKWINDLPYMTIHRIASNGKEKGIFETCLQFSLNKINNIRIDTHEDNKIMKYLLNKHMFIKCGTIYIDNGTKRTAYQLYKN